MMSKGDLFVAAAYLLSENGENPEYDRAICELVGDLTDMPEMDADQRRKVIEQELRTLGGTLRGTMPISTRAPVSDTCHECGQEVP